MTSAGVVEAHRRAGRPLEAFRALMPLQAIGDMRAVRPEELDAHLDLLKRQDGGAAFLRIMRGFERTPAKRDLLRAAVRDVPCPVQVVWGEGDPSLRVDVEGEEVRRAAGLAELHRVPGKHFLQEDQAPAIADRVAALACAAGAGHVRRGARDAVPADRVRSS